MSAARQANDAVQNVRDIATRLSELASESDWEEAGQWVINLRRAILRVPPAQKARLIREVRPVIERIAVQASEEHSLVGDQLTGMRRGQQATQAYEAR